MVSLAKENLLYEKLKVALSIGGVVLGVFLIFATVGLYYGIEGVVEKMVLRTGADLWVTSKGASGSIHSPSILSTEIEESLKRIDGVREVTPLIRMPVATEINGNKQLLYVTGYNTEAELGGPWAMVDGASRPAGGEIIVDRVLAENNNLQIGQNLTIEGQEFRIGGISDETFIFIASMVFVPFEDARAFLPAGLTNFFLVKVESPLQTAEVKSRIEDALPGVSVSTSATNAAQGTEETVGGFLPIIFVISAIGVLVGVLVVGLLVYTMTIEKSREYGIVRAIGANNFYLYKIVLFQALAISVLGFIMGAIVSFPAISLLQSLVPEFIVLVTPQMVLWVFLLFVATGIIASFIPVRRLIGIDPATVFKER